jgi:hypothetical protein
MADSSVTVPMISEPNKEQSSSSSKSAFAKKGASSKQLTRTGDQLLTWAQMAKKHSSKLVPGIPDKTVAIQSGEDTAKVVDVTKFYHKASTSDAKYAEFLKRVSDMEKAKNDEETEAKMDSHDASNSTGQQPPLSSAQIDAATKLVSSEATLASALTQMAEMKDAMIKMRFENEQLRTERNKAAEMYISATQKDAEKRARSTSSVQGTPTVKKSKVGDS